MSSAPAFASCFLLLLACSFPQTGTPNEPASDVSLTQHEQSSATEPRSQDRAVVDQVAELEYVAKGERVEDFARILPLAAPRDAASQRVIVERITAGVPWPRGLALVDGELVVLARGRHRRAGGIDPKIADLSGSLLKADPEVAETVVPGQRAGKATRNNARLFVEPDGGVFALYDPSRAPIDSVAIDRPYCTLAYDAASRNIFVCGFSGVDLPGSKFRKNASDSIHRYDLRSKRWYTVEMHDHRVVPESEFGYVVPNGYYPHHDVAKNPAPHGWLNGPDACGVAGDYLYAAGKDNHLIAQYDLRAIRDGADAGPPPSRPVIGPRIVLRLPSKTGERETEVEVLGPSAIAAHGGFLYVGYRTSSVILRFPIDARGDLVHPLRAEVVALFEPWNSAKKRSANLIDIAFNSKGELFVSCAKEARIWKVGVPDPRAVFFGNDRASRPTSAKPYVDIRRWTGKKAGCGNLLFDKDDRLYFCVGNYDHGKTLAGAVYRASPATDNRLSAEIR